jgi:hypothetical protein
VPIRVEDLERDLMDAHPASTSMCRTGTES